MRYMIAKVVKTGKDGIMMKLEDGTGRTKEAMMLGSVEDLMLEIIGMGITGRGRSRVGNESLRNPDIGQGQILRNHGWMSALGMQIGERKTPGPMTETESERGAEDEKMQGRIKEMEIVLVRRSPG